MGQHKYCHFVHELAIVSICAKTVHNKSFDEFSSGFHMNWLTFSCHYIFLLPTFDIFKKQL
jgi:hypothetical protein